MVFPDKLPTQDAGKAGVKQQKQLALAPQHPQTASTSPSLPLVPLLLSVYNLVILREQFKTITCRYIIYSSPSSRKASQITPAVTGIPAGSFSKSLHRKHQPPFWNLPPS